MNTKQDKAYTMCFLDYVRELENLGVPVKSFRNDKLMGWFDTLLHTIEKDLHMHDPILEQIRKKGSFKIE